MIGTTPPLKPDDYRFTVQSVMPHASDSEIDARCALLFVQYKATEAREKCGVDAWAIFDHVERLARMYAFARVPLEALNHLRKDLRDLVVTAGELDKFSALLDPAPEVENARG